MADVTAKPGTRLSLATTLFLTTALLVVLAVGAAVLVTNLLGRQVGERAVKEALGRSSSVQAMLQSQRLERLRLIARLITDNPSFKAYMQEALAVGDGLSIQDQLDERRGDLGFDFAAVLDSQGKVAARTDGVPTRSDDLSGKSLVVEALQSFEAIGVWAKDGRLYEAVTVPIDLGATLAGFVITAFALDDTTALELRRISGAEVALLSLETGQPTLAASTFDAGIAGELAALIKTRPPWFAQGLEREEAPEPVVVELKGRDWLVVTRPLLDASGSPAGAVISLASLDEQLAPYQRISVLLLGVGLGAMLLVSAASFFLNRRVLRPVRELVDATQAAAEGNYERAIVADRSDEVGRLAAAFQRLLAELREKRDMEVYINELTRNLPESDHAEPAAEAIVPPETRRVALLGVELRLTGSELSAATPRETMDRLGQEVRRVANAVAGQSGRLEAVAGHRLIAHFEGPRQTERALAAASALLARWRESGGAAASGPALALATGEAVRGSLSWGEHPQVTVAGGPMQELEGLLRGARPGDLLVSKSAYVELTEVFARAGLELREHTLAKTLSLYLLDAEMAARVTHQGIDATREITTAPSGTPSLPPIGPGSVIADRFVLLKELGAGGMGVVFKARDRSLGVLVALKMLKANAWDDKNRLDQLKSELLLARKISHPNVLSTFDFGEYQSMPFISMEYVRGITLRQSLDQSGRPPFTAGLRLARQLCRGLAAAHAQGVLHRDIKPENLIIEGNGNVKLMDFGIAQPMRRATTATQEPGVLVGTPFYLAPEQIEGKEADVRADVYASGVVFYELFTGQLPFDRNGTLMQILSRKVKEDSIPPSRCWPEIPPTLEHILMRCLERDRDRRYRDVNSLLADLEQLRG